MAATDVAPTRLAAAQEAGKHFADELTPAINLGLVKFCCHAQHYWSPRQRPRRWSKQAIDSLQPAPNTATGEGIFTALQAIATVGAVMGGGDGPPPARIVLESDGAKTYRWTRTLRREPSPPPARPKTRECRYRRSPSVRRTAPLTMRAPTSRFPSTIRPCRKSARSPTVKPSTPTAWNRSRTYMRPCSADRL